MINTTKNQISHFCTSQQLSIWGCSTPFRINWSSYSSEAQRSNTIGNGTWLVCDSRRRALFIIKAKILIKLYFSVNLGLADLCSFIACSGTVLSSTPSTELHKASWREFAEPFYLILILVSIMKMDVETSGGKVGFSPFVKFLQCQFSLLSELYLES